MSAQNSLLIIDDDPKFRLLMSKLLDVAGHEVESVSNVSGAIKVLDERHFDLIILDLNLVNEKGSDFLLYRQGIPRLSEIPVIVCSSENRGEVVRNVIRHGACDYIIKPIRQSDVLKKIKKALKQRSSAEHIFEAEEKKLSCSLTVDAEIFALGEAYCKVKSPARMPKNMKFTVSGEKHEGEAPLLDKRPCRANMESKAHSGSFGYETFATMIGVTEEEAHETRKTKAGWSE